jgi:hypothetical protein
VVALRVRLRRPRIEQLLGPAACGGDGEVFGRVGESVRACPAVAGHSVYLNEQDRCTKGTRDDGMASFVDRDRAILGI